MDEPGQQVGAGSGFRLFRQFSQFRLETHCGQYKKGAWRSV